MLINRKTAMCMFCHNYFYILALSLSFSLIVPVCCTRGRGSHVHVCLRPCSSTDQWAKHATHQREGPHSPQSVLSRATWTAHPSHTKQTGLSPKARTGSFSFGRGPFPSETWMTVRRCFFLRHGGPPNVLHRVWNAPPGAILGPHNCSGNCIQKQNI